MNSFRTPCFQEDEASPAGLLVRLRPPLGGHDVAGDLARARGGVDHRGKLRGAATERLGAAHREDFEGLPHRAHHPRGALHAGAHDPREGPHRGGEVGVLHPGTAAAHHLRL